MKRIWLAVMVAAAISAEARADFGGPSIPQSPPAPTPEGAYGAPDQGCQERYGLHPLFRRAMWWKKDCGAGGCGKIGGGGRGGCGPGGCGPNGAGAWNGVPGSGMPGSPGMYMPGTLVFPNHWYARGPRDYFMYDAPRY